MVFSLSLRRALRPGGVSGQGLGVGWGQGFGVRGGGRGRGFGRLPRSFVSVCIVPVIQERGSWGWHQHFFPSGSSCSTQSRCWRRASQLVLGFERIFSLLAVLPASIFTSCAKKKKKGVDRNLPFNKALVQTMVFWDCFQESHFWYAKEESCTVILKSSARWCWYSC